METAKAASAAESSSNTIKYVTESSAMPSNSSGVQMPRKPSLPSSSMTSRGKWVVRSHSAANGSIFSRANSRANSTTCCRMSGASVAVDIKPHARFSAEPPRRDHLLEQPGRTVLRIGKTFDHHVENREADVEPDQIGERQRPERMLHAERHHLIDRLSRGDPFLHAQDRLVDHRHQHAIGYKPRRIIYLDGCFAKFLGNLDNPRCRACKCLDSLYNLHQRH